MLARRRHPPHHAVRIDALLVFALTACSTLPEASYPPFAEHHVAADFVVPAVGRLRMPATTRDLVVQELGVDPLPQQEQFGAHGERWLLYPAGTPVHVRCRFRAYARADGSMPGPTDVLPGAANLRQLEAP